MLNEDDRKLAAGYALGTLEEAEGRQVEARLAAGDAALRAAISEIADVTAPMAERPEPSTSLRDRLVAMASADGLEAPLPRPAPMPVARAATTPPAEPVAPAVAAPTPTVAATAPATPAVPKVVTIAPHRSLLERFANVSAGVAVTLLLLSAVLLLQWVGLRRRVAELDTQKHGLEGQLVQEHERGRWLDAWSSPAARITEFRPGPSAIPQLGGRALYDPASQRAVLVFDHVQVPAGHVLQAWAMRPDGPTNLGLVHPTLDGRAEMRIEAVGDPGSLSAFAVSVERAGGAAGEAPIGPVVLVARLGD